jgi:Ca2+-binding EF-hand superfamily protein
MDSNNNKNSDVVAKDVMEDMLTRNRILAIVWFLWLIMGSIFYTSELDLNFATGFYMAVNIGYSIGFGDIPETGHLGSQWFSTVYVLIGASFVGAALGIFAEHIVANKDNWYEQEKLNLEYAQNIKYCHRVARMWYFCVYHKSELCFIILWVLFVVVATLAAWDTNDEFNFTNALYFAVSSLSTGGHYSLPGGNREWVYGLTGLYCAVGVPLMGVAMATIASFFIDVGSIEDTLKEIKKPVTKLEIDMLTEFGLADEDGEIDKSEFIILCMVRTGAASPELIKLIEQYFNELDDDNSGTLSIEEILKNRDQATAAADKLLDRASHHEEENAVIHQAVAVQKKTQSARRRTSVIASSVIAAVELIEHGFEEAFEENPMQKRSSGGGGGGDQETHIDENNNNSTVNDGA